MSAFSSICCNPSSSKGHGNVQKNLRSVTSWMRELFPELHKNAKICDKCRKLLGEMHNKQQSEPEYNQPEENTDFSEDDSCEVSVFAKHTAIKSLNDSLVTLGGTPIKKKRLSETNYCTKKLQKVSKTIQNTIFPCVRSEEPSMSLSAESEMISQLKEKFALTSDRDIKVQILTVLPRSWSLDKIQQEFEVTNYMARKARELVKEKGVMSSPNPKPGKSLPRENVNIIKQFYCDDAVSRIMPGRKDFVSMRVDGKKCHVQKRLLLCTLKEAYMLFKTNHPEMTVGFSKFADLRPKNCVLPGCSGTHSVCVCTQHQNVKLMIIGCRIKELTAEEDMPISDYKDCLARAICNPPLPKCYFGKCEYCPGFTELRKKFENIYDSNFVDVITYKQWVAVDRSNLETVLKPVDEFLDSLFGKHESLLSHSFIAREQSNFISEKKNSLEECEYLVICDFSENYSFVLQDSVQGFHWNNAQSTVHPFVIYYSADSSEDPHCVKHESFVVISECLQHDTTAVYTFQRKLMEFLNNTFSPPKKILYFSDGAASQYKNHKNFTNLSLHQQDFGCLAEWHFFATSHGKNACDGVGGTVKRLAARASLQKPYAEQIMTPRQLYEWASHNIEGMTFTFVTTEEYENMQAFLHERFSNSRYIPGTQKLHCVIPLKSGKLITKVFSSAEQFKLESTIPVKGQLEMHEIHGFVTCAYDGHWWLGCVISVHENTDEIKISFLHPHGPAPSFVYPQVPDILVVHVSSVLAKVDPLTATGRTYVLTKQEVSAVHCQLDAYKRNV